MVNVSKLRFHERSHAERPNLLVLVTTIGNKNLENLFISNGKYENWKNSEQCGISNGRTIQKLPILRAKFCFSKLTKFYKFFNLPISTQVQKFAIGKIPNIVYLKNFKHCLFGKFQKFSIWKIPKISQILQFRKSLNFWNYTISKNVKF